MSYESPSTGRQAKHQLAQSSSSNTRSTTWSTQLSAVPTVRTDAAPVLISSAEWSIAFNAGNGSVVGTVSADAGSGRTFSLESSPIFAINSSTGQVTIADNATLTRGWYTLNVTVTYSDGQTDTAKIVVTAV